MKIDRRGLLGWTGLAGAALAVPALGITPKAPANTGGIEQALHGFDTLPGDVAYMLRVKMSTPWETSRNPATPLFVGSAVKTFILAQFLKDVEDGRLDEAVQLPVDDSVRSISSPVFGDLIGKTPAKSVLEAMIAHSDNTATDIALKQVGVDRVRGFIAGAGLTSAKVPTSTRALFAYLAGAAAGADIFWADAQKISDGHYLGPTRTPMNDVETMKCSAADMVGYYERILGGEFIRTSAMRTEFRRISSMADSLWLLVPQDTPAYGKGGSIQWEDFNCFAAAGQMLLDGRLPVTFSFCVNWTGKPETIPGTFNQFAATIKAALAATAKAFG
jgi:beta-lactamase class A